MVTAHDLLKTSEVDRKERHGLNTWTPSMTQRSPTSKGCMTKRKMIASKMVLHVLPNMKTMRSNWDETRTSSCEVAIPSTSTQMIRIIINNTPSKMRCNFLTAVFVSLNDKARARLSLYTFT